MVEYYTPKNKIEKVTDLILDVSHADKAVCVLTESPNEPNNPLCTFTDHENDKKFTLGFGSDEDKGRNRFYHYRGNNKNLAEKYEDDEVEKKVELFNHSNFTSGGACFTKNKGESKPIPDNKCIVQTSGQFQAISQDGAYIFINKGLKEIKGE